MNNVEVKPQPGPQVLFLSTSANIAIYGGAAGGGKSFSLLLEPLRHYNNKLFSCVFFRRTTKQVRNKGGLWDEALRLYPSLGAIPIDYRLEFIFPSKMRVQFAHLEHEKNVYDYQGAQIPLILFDELTHFTEAQFWYLMSRLRSTSGVPGYMRATCNADADSWVRRLIDWWIDPATGLPILERAGVLRWFVRINDQLHWADHAQDLINQFGEYAKPKSITFIPAKLEDNKILIQKDPQYESNLDALPLVDRQRLKYGNWNAKAKAGMVFKKSWFEIVDAAPANLKIVRYWDRASTEPSAQNPDPDYTVGLKVGRDPSGSFYVLDRVKDRVTSHKVETMILNTTKQDGLSISPWLEVDPGQAGIFEKNHYVKLLAGFNIQFNRPTSNKVERAKIPSAQAEAGNIKILKGSWNEDFLSTLEAFPDAKHDDDVDTLSGSIAALTQTGVGEFTQEMTESEVRPIVGDDNPILNEW